MINKTPFFYKKKMVSLPLNDLGFRDLIILMKMCGKTLVNELPLHTSAVNMTRRMLKIVRDEYATACHTVRKLTFIRTSDELPMKTVCGC